MDGTRVIPRYAKRCGGVILAMIAATGCQNGSSGGVRLPWQNTPAATAAADAPNPNTGSNALADLARRQEQQTQLAEEQRRQLAQLNQLYQQSQQAQATQQSLRSADVDRLQQELQQQTMLAQQRQEEVQRYEDVRRRSMELDSNNQDLHAQLAKSQQQIRLLEDQSKLLRDRLSESATQLAGVMQQSQTSEQRVEALQAAVRRRGSASISANSSLTRDLTAITIAGVPVRQDGDVVRIEIASDQLFLPQSASLHPNANALLQRVADALQSSYGRQLIGVEAHTDNQPVDGTAWRSTHQLSAAQAMAVFDQLTQQARFSPQQLFVLGHGPNHPLAANTTPDGQARNRRVEIVVYPETLDQR